MQLTTTMEGVKSSRCSAESDTGNSGIGEVRGG